MAYTYDNLDRVTEVKASKDGTSYTIGRYIYDKLGRVARFVDGQVSGKSCTYGYDLTDRLCEAVFDDGTAYRYDGDGQLFAISYKGSDYYYIRDNLRAITRLVDANGVAVVNYRYDSWGRMLDITGSMAESLGKDNPYRYKGYCYDEETGCFLSSTFP